jgi:hypothetical protein
MAPHRSGHRAPFQDQRILARTNVWPETPSAVFEEHCEHVLTRFGGRDWTAVERAVRILVLASVGHSARWLSRTINRLAPSMEPMADLACEIGEASVYCATMTVLAALGMSRGEQNDLDRRPRRLCVAAATLRALYAAAYQYKRELANLMSLAAGSDFEASSTDPVITEAWKRFDVVFSLPSRLNNSATAVDIEHSAAYRYLLQFTEPTKGTSGGRPPELGLRVILTVGLLEFFPAINELSPVARGYLYEVPAWGESEPIEQLADVPWVRPDLEHLRGFLQIHRESVRDRVRKNESRYSRLWQEYIDAQQREGSAS